MTAFVSLPKFDLVAVRASQSSNLVTRFTPRQDYDIATVSTFIAFWTARYWKYPDNVSRGDVEVFAGAMAILWHVGCTFDPSIYWYMWFIGGLSHLHSRALLGGGLRELSSDIWVGVHFGGYMTLCLLLMDILAPRS